MEYREAQARYLKIDVPVRYGEDDMPLDAPKRQGDVWITLIDLDNHKVVDWVQGETLNIRLMKVTDSGIYTLYDVGMNQLAELKGYVPGQILPHWHNDYLILDIGADGTILNWLPEANLSDFENQQERHII